MQGFLNPQVPLTNGPKCQELLWTCIPVAGKSFGNWGKEDTVHLLKTGVPPAINLSLTKASVKLPGGQQFLSGLKTKRTTYKLVMSMKALIPQTNKWPSLTTGMCFTVVYFFFVYFNKMCLCFLSKCYVKPPLGLWCICPSDVIAEQSSNCCDLQLYLLMTTISFKLLIYCLIPKSYVFSTISP